MRRCADRPVKSRNHATARYTVDMILASAAGLGLTLSIAAALAYAIPALGGRRLGDDRGRRSLLLAWLLHGLQLAVAVFADRSHFGFAQTLSVTVWLVLAFYLLETRFYPRLVTRWPLAGLGSLTIVASMLYPGTPLPKTSSALLEVHWALGLAAYGLLGLAAMHGWLMTHADQHLRRPLEGAGSSLPLLTLERLMFRFVTAGFLLLTLTLLVGIPFGEQLYGSKGLGWHWDHKHVFILLSWGIFALLLAGHWWLGWRGRRAVHMLYAGAALLLLGYAGSRFVLEVLLTRAP